MMRRALMPIQRRLQRHPVVRRETLIDAERSWRGLPAFGRVHCTVDVRDRRAPTFDDVRIVAGEYRGIGWADVEPGLVVVLFCAGVVGTAMALRASTIATFGLHALARRYQRAPRGQTVEPLILAEIGEVALRFPTIAPAGGDFIWPVQGGSWRGDVIESTAGEVCLTIRTFIDADGGTLRLAA
jgi:hypothetical protein